MPNVPDTPQNRLKKLVRQSVVQRTPVTPIIPKPDGKKDEPENTTPHRS